MSRLTEGTPTEDPSDGQGAAERRQLLDAAMRVMAGAPDNAALVSAILAEAGLSTRAFYRHFASKDDLLCAVYRRDVTSLAHAIERAVQAPESPQLALEAWIDAILSIRYEASRSRRALVIGATGVRAASGFDKELDHARDLLIAPLRTTLEAGLRDGSFPHAVPDEDAATLYAMVWSVLDRPMDSGSRMTFAEARAHLRRFILPALGADDTRA